MSVDLDSLESTGLLIGGRDRPGGSGRFDDVAPRDGTVFATAPDADVDDVHAAVGAAREAFDHGPWPRMSPAQRGRCLEQLATALAGHQELLTSLSRLEWGVANDEFSQVEAATYVAAEHAQLAAVVPEEPAAPGHDGSTGTILNRPHGVVAAITPWNYPHILAVSKVAAAITAGNTVVLKPSPLSPLVAMALGRLVTEETDIPAGVVNIVPTTSVDAARALTSDPRVDMISFTGSTEVGKQIAATAALSLTRLVLELGGKSPVIYLDDLDDAELDALTTRTLYEGATRHSGQACILTSRLLVPARIHDRVVEQLAHKAAEVVVGDPLDDATQMGPMISARLADTVLGHVRRAVDDGATLVSGGERLSRLGEGAYLAPTILSGVTSSMAVAQDELFGPVLSVISYSDDAEAVAIANDSRFGLVASVFGGDTDRAEAVGRQLRVGQVTVNGSAALGAFGGFGDSGMGRETGLVGAREYTEPSAVSRPAGS